MATVNGKAASMERYPSSGLDVLVVGGGLGGLTFAIEAHRKGHCVRVEKRPGFAIPVCKRYLKNPTFMSRNTTATGLDLGPLEMERMNL